RRSISMGNDTLPSAARIWEHCETLARCSEQADALTRVFLSKEQRVAGDLVLGWMREAGMSARLDEIGNCVGRYDGDRPGSPCLVLGSHLDTVRDAGKYDGMLGVVAAIECVHALNKQGKRLPFAIEVLGFADEEGVRFGCTLLGSRAVAGTFDPTLLEKIDHEDVSMRQALRISALIRRRSRAPRTSVTTCWRTPSCISSRAPCWRQKASRSGL